MTDKQHATAALLEDSTLLKKGRADVFAQRERTKRKRLLRGIVLIGLLDVYLFHRFIDGNPFQAARAAPGLGHPLVPDPDPARDRAHDGIR